VQAGSAGRSPRSRRTCFSVSGFGRVRSSSRVSRSNSNSTDDSTGSRPDGRRAALPRSIRARSTRTCRAGETTRSTSTASPSPGESGRVGIGGGPVGAAPWAVISRARSATEMGDDALDPDAGDAEVDYLQVCTAVRRSNPPGSVTAVSAVARPSRAARSTAPVRVPPTRRECCMGATTRRRRVRRGRPS
jgi:hypothetical protein